MEGAKALALDAFAASQGAAILRFDYSGTGSSGGSFEDGTLTAWLDQAHFLIDQLIEGPVIPVGSSMGGWIALHLALRLPRRIRAVVGIAAAPDFTDWGFSAEHKAKLVRHGRIERSSEHGGEPQITTRAFWESGQSLRLLGDPIHIDCPVRLVHGDGDADVPLHVPMELTRRLRSDDVQLNIIKGGGHRLSEPREIEAIVRTVATLLEPAQ